MSAYATFEDDLKHILDVLEIGPTTRDILLNANILNFTALLDNKASFEAKGAKKPLVLRQRVRNDLLKAITWAG